MAQQTLDPAGGRAPMIGVRLLYDDVYRLARLARQRRVSQSQVTRELLRHALDQIDQLDAIERAEAEGHDG